MGKQNATPEESRNEALRRQEIAAQREQARLDKIEHDKEVERLKAEGEARRREALEQSKRQNDK